MYTEHPYFEPPKDINVKVWRYMDLSKFLSLLETSSLYFTRSDKFIDPYEGSIPKLNTDSISNVFSEFDNSNEMRNELINLFNVTRKMTLINCWYLSEYESDAMWQIYSNNGIAIQTTYNKLKESFNKSIEDILIGQVKYIDYDTEAMVYLNAITPYLYKRRSFEHEKELRAVIWNPKTHRNLTDENDNTFIENDNVLIEFVEHGKLAEIDLDKLIESIYVSPTAPSWFYQLITPILKKYNLDKPVIHSQLYVLDNNHHIAEAKPVEKITISKDLLDHFYKKDSYRMNIETLQKERIKFREYESIQKEIVNIETELSKTSFIYRGKSYLGKEALFSFSKISHSKNEIQVLFNNETYKRIYFLSGKYETLLRDINNSSLSDKEKNILVRKVIFSYTENLFQSAFQIVAQFERNNIDSPLNKFTNDMATYITSQDY